jgi:hypothetical protein
MFSYGWLFVSHLAFTKIDCFEIDDSCDHSDLKIRTSEVFGPNPAKLLDCWLSESCAIESSRSLVLLDGGSVWSVALFFVRCQNSQQPNEAKVVPSETEPSVTAGAGSLPEGYR